MEIRIIADITAAEGYEEKLSEQLLSLAVESRNETGCITYTVHRHAERTGRFFIYEVWENAEKLEEHKQSVHFQNFLSISETTLGNLDVHLIEALN